MKALITGGSGFIGSELVRQLIGQGVEARLLLRPTSPRDNLAGVEFETATGDLGDLDSLKRAVAGVDYVFHLAGAISARTKEEYFRHNATGTGNLARACAEANPAIKRFVYVSSLAASGPAKTFSPRVEEEPESPISMYGESKLGGEKELEKWAQLGRFPVSIVRPPAVYGPRDKGIFEFVKIVNSGLAPVFPSEDGKREKYYSVIHVDDLVQGIALAGLAEGQGASEIYFIAGDGVHSWSELMKAMADGLGKKKLLRLALPSFAWTSFAAAYTLAGWLTRKQFPLTLDKLHELRPDYWICSNERARKLLGFRPKWDLKQGMSQTIEWYRSNGWV